MIECTKSYVMIFYNNGTKQFLEVAERDPYQIEELEDIMGFKFFDITFFEDSGIIYQTRSHNFSNCVYFGEKYSANELVKRFPFLAKRKGVIKKGVSYCVLSNGKYIPLLNGDTTYEELLKRERRK